MDADQFPTADVSVDEIEPSELKRWIDAGDPVTILDTRASSEFEEWHIDGDTVEITNIPYFDFLDGLDADFLEQVPQGDPLVVLCAKGGASEYVAGLLKQEGRDVIHLEEGMNGWARIYDAVEIERYDGPGTVLQYQRPSSGCLGYLVYNDEEAAVVDPLQAFTDRYLTDAAELGVDLVYAFDTHIHADHISGLRALIDAGVTGVISEAAADRGVTYTDDVTLTTDGDTFDVGGVTIETVFTPGHTTGMTSFLIGDSLLTTGDGLFVESVARPDLEKGAEGAPEAAKLLYESLQERVLGLDDDVLIGGAHYSDVAEPAADGTYTATLGELHSSMEVLSYAEEDFIDVILSDMPPRPANYEEIIATNLGQRETSEDEAFRLELGPNNCAASQESLAGD